MKGFHYYLCRRLGGRMEISMNPLKYLRKHGVKHAWDVFYRYKADLIIQKAMRPFLKNKSLQDMIILESHNDFDCNGGALYDYLITNGYNEKYKLVWLLKHPEEIKRELPHNVVWVAQYKPGFRKNYYKWVAKYLLADQDCEMKLRDEQISVYTTHGSVALKQCRGLMCLPSDINYCLTASDFYAPIDAYQFMWDYPNDKPVVLGFPVHDVFYSDITGDLAKITKQMYEKTILWMPTFRKARFNARNDSTKDQPFGIPLFYTESDLKEFNKFLKIRNILVIIKLHPKQDIRDIRIADYSNICVLTGDSVKKLDIDNYRLMKDVDALISDYSSAAYDFLHANKPLAYDLSDLNEYKLGLVVEDPHEMMAGHEVRSIKDLYQFIESVYSGQDVFHDERQELLKKIYKYHDGNSCKRLVEFLGL